MRQGKGRLKVLMLETGGWGGIHYYAHFLCNALAKRSVAVALLTTEQYELEGWPRCFERLGLLRRENYLRTLLKIRRLLRDREPEVLHVQTLIAPRKDLLLLLLCRLMQVRVVLTVHNILPHEVRPLERALYFLYYRLADALILHSQHNREQLLRLVPALEGKPLYVVEHGNYEEFLRLEPGRHEARQRLGLPGAARIILFFGLIRPYKGLDLLLQTVEPVRAVCPQALFVVAGQVPGGGQAECRAQIDRLKVGEEGLQVRLGYLSTEEAIAYVCAADLVVLPYREIYQSGVLFFAYTFGRPVLATRVGSFPESIEEGRTGWLVDREDVEGLTQALIRLVNQPESLAEAGRHARCLAEERHGWEDIAAKTVRVYEEAIAEER